MSLLTRARAASASGPGPIFGDLVLGDEINRAPAKTQAALLEAMQERRVTVDGTSHPLPESFTVFATQNPIEFEGTYPLPEAELDRFLVKVLVGLSRASGSSRGSCDRVLGGFEADLPAELRHRAGGRRRRAWPGCATPCRRVRVEPSLVAYITAHRAGDARARRCSRWARRPAAAWRCSRWRRRRRCSTAGRTWCPTT